MLRNNHWNKVMLLALAAVLALTLAGCGKKKTAEGFPGAGEGKVVATYNDGSEKDASGKVTGKQGTVTDKEFDKYTAFFTTIVNPQAAAYLSISGMKEQMLKQYISYKVLESRVPQAEKDKLKDAADDFYNQVKTAFDQQPDMKKKLDDAGLTEDNLKFYYTAMQSIPAYEETQVKDEDVKKVYDVNPQEYSKVSVRHILVALADSTTGKELRKDADALKRAQEVKAKLEKGGDWTALAKEYSDDPGSKDNGGLYEDVEPHTWVKEFKEAAIKQEIGKIGDPVKTDYGYHVIKVEKRTPQTFDQVKDELKKDQAQTNLNTFMTDELPKLIVKIDLPKDTSAETGTTNGGTTNQGSTGQGSTNESKSGDAAKDNAAKTDDAAKSGSGAGDKTNTAK